MMRVERFEENKFYVMTPPGHQWSDYEGPFDTDEQALDFLRQFINEDRNYSPEMLGMAVVQYEVFPEAGQCRLVKRDGIVLNGQYLLGK